MLTNQVSEKVEVLFNEGDENADGVLTIGEFSNVCRRIGGMSDSTVCADVLRASPPTTVVVLPMPVCHREVTKRRWSLNTGHRNVQGRLAVD